MKKELITKGGYKKLWNQKKHLEKEIKKANFERGEASGGGGGWHENNLFEFLEEKLHHLTSRMYELNTRILNAKIVEDDIEGNKDGKVVFGSTVEINLDGQRQSFKVMGEAETDLSKNIISYQSPLGRSLFGKTVGEKTFVRTPQGKKEVHILVIS